MEGVFIVFSPKNSRWAKGYPETPGICPETTGNPRFSDYEQSPDTPGNGVWSIRVRQGKTSVFGSFELFCGSQVFV